MEYLECAEKSCAESNKNKNYKHNNLNFHRLIHMGDTKVRINLHDGTIEIEGSQEFVEKHWEELKSFLKKPEIQIKSIHNPNPSQNPPVKQSSGNQKPKKLSYAAPISFDIKKTEKKPALRDLYKEKNPSSDMEIVTLIAYYLKKYLTIDDVEFGHASFGYTVIGKKRPKDFLSTFKNAMNLKVWVRRGSQPNTFTITPAGEDFVSLELPTKKS